MDGLYAYIIGPDGHVIKRVDLLLKKTIDGTDIQFSESF